MVVIEPNNATCGNEALGGGVTRGFHEIDHGDKRKVESSMNDLPLVSFYHLLKFDFFMYTV